ncbi:transporter substrate-binding domain-containing protein [Methylobacterium sp. ARG-1]|uniref:transporter substrate-binding domain-containing protein n=1 Tax=Methylobacterium sp. ARG-1 TaxID=1692501 RepID=UPI0006800287|nr:transporter substrate-binding domain-containing protein [Methylobacterium sp. ARG-1]KNY24487.1 amino acid ABC transporter [Methylobacterium sp. ARG-1]
MNRRRLLALAALCAGFLGQPLAPSGARAGDLELIQPGKLQVATEGTFAPFSMRMPNGELDGLEIRVSREIARRLGLEYVPVIIKFDALLIGLMADQYDMTSASMDITPARQKQVAFADGWLQSGARIITRKDSGIASAADLKGRNVGAVAASTFGKLAEENGANLKSYKSAADAMQDLMTGNLDAVVNDAVAGTYAIKDRKLPLVMLDAPLSTIQKGLAIKKGKPNLQAAVNKALADMVADGTYAKLTTPLIGFSPAPKEPIHTAAQ